MRLSCPPLTAIGLLVLAWMASSPLKAEPPAGWKLVFSDEFEGQKLDTTKWSTTMEFPGIHGPRYHNEFYLSYTLDEDVVVQDGFLHLRTERQKVTGNEPAGLFDYSQGLVTTQGKFTFTYGYIEIRAKYPGGKGVWPCFWLMPEDRSWPPEFDIGEYYAGQHKMHHGLAYGTMRETKWDSSHDPDTDFENNWHTLGLEWTAGKAVWSVDGIPCKTVEAPYVPSIPMFVLLSNSVSSRFGPSGEPDAATVFPNDFAIDYIRVYQAPKAGIELVKADPLPAPKEVAPAAPVVPAAPAVAPVVPEAKPVIATLPVTPLP